MKNQYFGDVNDYRKYGLLRALQSCGEHKLLVVWMLTPDDGGTDGQIRSYLQHPGEWEHFDPELYNRLLHILQSPVTPRVSLLEGSGLLPRTAFYSETVPNDRDGRQSWREGLMNLASGADIVFFDPDNGIEVPSKPVGLNGSSKYVTWDEIKKVWDAGCSLLIYQHFHRKPRHEFAECMASKLQECTGAALTEAFRMPNVLFLLAAHPKHEASLREAIACVRRCWTITEKKEIAVVGLADKKMQRSSLPNTDC
ncbi:MAG: hypothetical protein ACLFPU_07290 [Dehalococcoidia bacterium]